jgi:DNA-binding FadR family transcriptional regulator
MSEFKDFMKPIKRPPSLHQVVQQSIKSHIVDNGLQPGDALPSENALSKELEVSRNLVREAVRGLEALGIVDIRRGSGLYVSNFSMEQLMINIDYSIHFEINDLKELFAVRRALEIGMVGNAIKAKTKEREDELKAILDLIRLKAERGQPFPEEDRSFHQCLFAALNNRTLLRILDVFWMVLNKADQIIDLRDKDPHWTYELHIPVVTAFVEGDKEAARSALLQHYANLENRLPKDEDDSNVS